MKVKKLKEELEKALKEGKVTEEDEVIAVGEYGYGMPVTSVTSYKVAETEEEILEENKDAFILHIPTYLYESEDVGYCRMYMDMNTLNEYRKYFESEEDE